LLLFLAVAAMATASHPRAQEQVPTAMPGRPGPPERTVGEAAGPDYRLGPNDQVSVTVLHAPELTTTARVSQGGQLSMPLLGAIRAGGLSVIELEQLITDRLREKYIRNPQVAVQVTDVRSRGVSVVGAVERPGVQQVGPEATLLGVISQAGGLAATAGDAVTVLRPGAPAPIDVPLKPLMDARDAALNIPVLPGDVVAVRAADVVYVVGAVNKPGAYAMRGNDRLTVLRALALGEGLAATAAKKDAVVVRTGKDGERTEIAVDLAGVLKGRNPDVTLQAHDVLFVPTSGSKVAGRTALDAVVRILTWRPY
jgi:polysaccharide export outer membrane protein